MSLPKLNFEFEFKPILIKTDRKIKFRLYNSDDEKVILAEMGKLRHEGKINEDTIIFIRKIIENNVIDFEHHKDFIMNLPYIEFLWLFFNIRSRSKSNYIESVKKCPKCNKDIETNIDIESDIKVINYKISDVEIPQFDIRFINKIPKIEVLDKLAKSGLEKFTDKDSSDSDISIDDIITVKDNIIEIISMFVDKVINITPTGDVIYDDFTLDEFKAFMKKFPTHKINEFKKIFNQLPSFKIDKKFTCNNRIKREDGSGFDKCDGEVEITMEGITNFLS